MKMTSQLGFIEDGMNLNVLVNFLNGEVITLDALMMEYCLFLVGKI